MPFGSEYAFPGISFKSADGKMFKVNNLTAIGLKIIGIPHLGMRYRAKKILEFVGKKPLKILEIGCGPGYLSLSLIKKGHEVTGLDLDEEKIKVAKEVSNLNKLKSNFLVGSALKLPFKKEMFDLVICSEVIEHIKEDKKVIKEILRVLKKNGRFILTVPADSKENKRIYKEMEHVLPGYNRELVKKLFYKEKVRYGLEYYGMSSLKLATRINRNIKNSLLIAATFYPLYLLSLFDKLFKREANGLIIRGIKK